MNNETENTTIEWSREMNVKLIEELKKKKSLWDVHCVEYRDKEQRKMDTEELAAIFSLPISEIGKKIHNLKSQFHREYRRSKTTSTSYKSKWYGFRLLKFLKGGSKGKSSKQTNKDDLWNLDITKMETNFADFHPPTVAMSPDKLSEALERKLDYQDKFANSKNRFYSLVSNQENSNKTNRDEHTVFGEYVSHEMRKIANPYLSTVTKHKIQECLFEAQMIMFSEADNCHECQNVSSTYSSCSSFSTTSSPLHIEQNME